MLLAYCLIIDRMPIMNTVTASAPSPESHTLLYSGILGYTFHWKYSHSVMGVKRNVVYSENSEKSSCWKLHLNWILEEMRLRRGTWRDLRTSWTKTCSRSTACTGKQEQSVLLEHRVQHGSERMYDCRGNRKGTIFQDNTLNFRQCSTIKVF